MTGFSDLPDGMLDEIMHWLPPESLREFKLVQKSWYLRIHALIRDPVFVAKHLGNMKKKMSLAPCCYFSHLMTVPGRVGRKGRRNIVDYGGSEIEIEDEEFGKHLLVLANPDYDGWDYIFCDTEDLGKLTRSVYYFRLVSQCNGIICLPDLGDGTVYLLNPALREMKIIHCPYGNDYQLRGVGFGYDLRESEYKVVAVMPSPLDEGSYMAEVYSLSTNSWRETKCDIKEQAFYGYHEQVYCNGAFYWRCCADGMKIFSFDFSDEVFRFVPLPVGTTRLPSTWTELEEWTKIGVWKESLVLFVFPSEVPLVIDVWVLDSLSGPYSWTKYPTIGPLEGIKRPLGFWDDVKLLLEAEDGEIKLYHLGSEVLSSLPKHVDRFHLDRFVIYQKSLVSVLRKEGR